MCLGIEWDEEVEERQDVGEGRETGWKNGGEEAGDSETSRGIGQE